MLSSGFALPWLSVSAFDCILYHPSEQQHNMSRTLEFNYKGVKERVLVFMLISISCLDLKASKLTHTIKKKNQTQCRTDSLTKDFLYGSSEQISCQNTLMLSKGYLFIQTPDL